MRQIFRFNFALVCTCLTIGIASDIQAQQAGKSGQKPAPTSASQSLPTRKAAPKDDAPPKKVADSKQVEEGEEEQRAALRKMLARLDQILDRWETESAKIKSLHGKQSRSEFNHVFSVEKISEGPFFLENPDKGRIDLKPIVIKTGMVSKKRNKNGEAFTLETGKPERWICTGEVILVVNDDEKTYQKEVIPEDKRGKNIVDSPLPFLFGMKAEDAKNRFQLSIAEETKDSVTLFAIPKMEKDRENYIKAAITLNKKTFLPSQVRMLDQSKLEIVYTFQDVVVNDSDWKSKMISLFGMEKDPFRPNLKGYSAVLPPEPEIQPTNGRVANGKDQMRPAGGAIQPSRDAQKSSPKKTSAANGSNSGTSKN